ncbi:hypothetical protein FRB94_003367 [Tulasnella sp. JGI-2019a]|nr:hypothetical protein FRB93_007951 [Tulasnella sp. JGI-2019a]KAG9003106.1 hypothetical protein FRB94_003367 [Tulasnella sp. JGI-2019a]KAG9025098.1 hypothetical protein FRB95_010571 [Tulasnella sp. JGI-2019a]
MPFAPKTYTFLCGCFAALGSILFGYDLGIIASILPNTDFLRVTGHPNANYLGFIVSAFLLGAFFGCIPAAILADRYGRRLAILVGAIVFLLGGTLQTAAQNKGMMLAGRFFAGFAVGMLSQLAPLYQSEIAHPSIRGRLTTLQQFFLGIGAFIASFVGYGCYKNYPDGPAGWRLPLALQMAPAVPLAAMIFLFPESPRWLCKVGRDEDAIKSLARLHANGNVNDVFVQSEIYELKLSVDEEARLTKNAWRQIFTIPQNLRRVFLGFVLQASVQFTGVSVIQYYSTLIFSTIGIDANKTLLLQSINSILALFGEACCIAFVDRLGRRWPLIGANIVSGMTFIAATAIQAIYPNSHHKVSAGWAFVMMTWIFNFAFSSAIGPISWAYPVEILNTGIRAKGTALTSMGAWLFNFFIGQVSPIALQNIGWKYYIVFAVGGFTNALTVYLFFPETKGRTLEEMDGYFARTYWIVPLAAHEVIDHRAREKDLSQGIVPLTNEKVVGVRSISPNDDYKGDIVHNEKVGGTSV